MDEALVDLSFAINGAKNQGVRVLKVIHGYGSHGKGGAIKRAVHQELCELRRCMQVTDFVRGEDFGLFNETSQKIFAVDESVSHDIDYNKRNPGITVVLI